MNIIFATTNMVVEPDLNFPNIQSLSFCYLSPLMHMANQLSFRINLTLLKYIQNQYNTDRSKNNYLAD